jgi:hypothetical protein
MTQLSETDNRIRISQDFFCDGHCYLLTSSSLGGSGLTAQHVSDALFDANEDQVTDLLKKGVCFPVCFEGDCALDGNTLFVSGDLSEREEKDWIARLSWKLNIPCGKLILCCGCLADDLEPAIDGVPPDKHFVIYQVIDVPPGEYLVEIYAYFSSMTVQVTLNDFDEDEYDPEDFDTFDLDDNFHQAKAKYERYRQNRPGVEGVDYIVRLKPLETEPPMPKLSRGWFQDFEFRPFD